MPATPTADRFARQVTLPGFGRAGQERLAAARVVVVGAGGLGSALLPVLVATGIGTVVVVDGDQVEATNLHRQTLHGERDLGRDKAASAVDTLTAIAAEGTTLIADARFVDEIVVGGLVAGADLVIDATDSLELRYLLDEATETAGIPLVWGSATGTTGQVGVSVPGSARWRDLFPARPDDADVLTCAIGGVLPSLCTTIGGLMATEALKLLVGLGRPLVGRLLVVDALAPSVREIVYGAADATEPQDPAGSEQESGMTDEADVSVEEVAALLERGDQVQLVDVREPWEAEIASLPGSILIPLGSLEARLGELDPDVPVITYCHAGVRSQDGADRLRAAGFRVRSMAGGINRWSRQVDPSVPRY
ncbi:MAG TPA: ThiF family adenylyltransferase [Amnibacterium sp.]|uniref:ThiF family adenylyltransferase n=1 Tax=Amnibacterium sp. TaxID=1872496 RepID=UPI002F9262B4